MICNTTPLNTWRNNNVMITSKRRHFDVITSKWHPFDVIMTSLSPNVSAGICWWCSCGIDVMMLHKISDLSFLINNTKDTDSSALSDYITLLAVYRLLHGTLCDVQYSWLACHYVAWENSLLLAQGVIPLPCLGMRHSCLDENNPNFRGVISEQFWGP